MPAVHSPDDVVWLTMTGDDSTDDATWLRGAWEKAQAMADGLNAAAVAAARTATEGDAR